MPENGHSSSEDRLYTVQWDEYCNFRPGRSGWGEQVLIGVTDDSVIALFFDKSGRLVKREKREASFDDSPGLQPPESSQRKSTALRNALHAWQEEIGSVPGEVKVRQFSLPESFIQPRMRPWRIGIADLPVFLLDFLEDPSGEPPEADREGFREVIDHFRQDGKYVLLWGTEYRMSSEGEITDT